MRASSLVMLYVSCVSAGCVYVVFDSHTQSRWVDNAWICLDQADIKMLVVIVITLILPETYPLPIPDTYLIPNFQMYGSKLGGC